MSHYIGHATVMGPEGALLSLQSEFSEKVPPAFSEKELYRTYRKEVELWSNFNILALEKQ